MPRSSIRTSDLRCRCACAGAVAAVPAPADAIDHSDALDITLRINGTEHSLRLDPHHAARRAARASRAHRHQEGLRSRAVRRLHRAGRRPPDQRLPDPCGHAAEQDITTIEGLAQDGALHPLQAAFIEHDGFQCGYCTPGQIMSAVGLLAEGARNRMPRSGVHERQHLPVRRLHQDRRGDQVGRGQRRVNVAAVRLRPGEERSRRDRERRRCRWRRLHRRRHGPDAADEGGRRSAAPSGRRQPPALHRDHARRARPAARGAGAHERRRRRSRRARALSGHRAGAAGERVRPGAQHGLDRRQPAAAHAAPTSATRPCPATSALRAAAARSRAITACTRSSAAASAASRRTLGSRGRSGRARRRGPGGGPGGEERRIPIEEFHRLPGNTPERDTVLEPGELILAVEVPASAAARRSHYLKIRDRASFEFALVSVAAGLDVGDGAIRAARLAAGGVGTKPWRLHSAEAALIGRPDARDIPGGSGSRRGGRKPAAHERLQGRAAAARGAARAGDRRRPGMSRDGRAAQPRRRSRQGDRRRQVRRRVLAAGSGLRRHRSEHDRQGADHRDRRRGGRARARRARGDHAPERAQAALPAAASHAAGRPGDRPADPDPAGRSRAQRPVRRARGRANPGAGDLRRRSGARRL